MQRRTGVYNLRKDNKQKEYYLEFKQNNFIMPEKLYGRTEWYTKRFWKSFIFNKSSMGILLTGLSGSGKTLLTDNLSNVALANNMDVVIVSELNADLELITFIDKLSNIVVLLDEFGKLFNISQQEKMLTMFSNVDSNKKLFMITENRDNDVSYLIRNRPSRVHYWIKFGRVDKNVVIDYCKDKNVTGMYYKELLKKYDESLVFSFDHLIALVKEHIRFPETTFEEALEILNLKVLTREKELKPINITNIKTKEVMKQNGDTVSIKVDHFNTGRHLYIYLENGDNLHISNNNIIHVEDNVIECKTDKYLVKLEEI